MAAICTEDLLNHSLQFSVFEVNLVWRLPCMKDLVSSGIDTS